jgi:predicted CXXCH cytochrome family protein
MKLGRYFLRLDVCAFLLATAVALSALAQEVDCLKCHGALTGKKNVHAAIQAGCAYCHADLDASVTPHKVRRKLAHGLSAEPPELCNACHEKNLFEGKFTHAPAAAGLCVTCHDPHASEYPALGRKAGAALCLDCHSEITKKPHVIAGFPRRGHPLGDEPRSAAAQDPLRPGKSFYCASCHDPHRADYARLTRFEAKSMNGFCQKCHKK